MCNAGNDIEGGSNFIFPQGRLQILCIINENPALTLLPSASRVLASSLWLHSFEKIKTV